MTERHALVWLADAGWQQARAATWDDAARACLSHWADAGLPLVVTQQRRPGRLALGLPAPLRFDRRRLAIEIAGDDRLIAQSGQFPRVADVLTAWPDALRPPWRALDRTLDRLGCTARVYGGFGWQHLTGLPYVHADSDIDLLLPVADARSADAVCAALTAAEASPALATGPRIDGELLVDEGGQIIGTAGIAWREWRQWRGKQVDRLLVKRTCGVTLERSFGADRVAV